jgi:hypothetical protein
MNTLLINGSELEEFSASLAEAHLDNLGMVIRPAGYRWEALRQEAVNNALADLDAIYGEGFAVATIDLMLSMVRHNEEYPEPVEQAVELLNDKVYNAIAVNVDIQLEKEGK